MGAWTLYGLGSENKELPGFITINPAGGAQSYGSAFLPASFQATKIDGVRRANRRSRWPISTTRKLSAELQRKQLDLLASSIGSELATRRGQSGSGRSDRILRVGIPHGGSDARGHGPVHRNASHARRLWHREERDRSVRPAVLAGSAVRESAACGSSNWESAVGTSTTICMAKLTSNAHAIDKPIAALLADLKQRGMLKDTLVVWGGEFGRTPSAQKADGRDHNNKGFSMWMAGGGVKGGYRHGTTDEHGSAAVENTMHINDLHATMLYLLGLDHTKLTYQYSGREIRLTDLAGNVAKDVIA